MKKILIFILLIILIFYIPISVQAHSGGTDGSGGHYDHSTGDYHYHHGYPAHDHPNGECPYTSNSNSSSSNNSGKITALIGGGLIIAFIIWVYFPRDIFKKLDKPKNELQNANSSIKSIPPKTTPKNIYETPPELRDSVELLKRLMYERNLAYSDDSDIIWYFDEDLPLKELTEEYANQVIDNFLKSVEKND